MGFLLDAPLSETSPRIDAGMSTLMGCLLGVLSGVLPQHDLVIAAGGGEHERGSAPLVAFDLPPRRSQKESPDLLG